MLHSISLLLTNNPEPCHIAVNWISRRVSFTLNLCPICGVYYRDCHLQVGISWLIVSMKIKAIFLQFISVVRPHQHIYQPISPSPLHSKTTVPPAGTVLVSGCLRMLTVNKYTHSVATVASENCSCIFIC